jgi:hypothetical protein
MTNSNFYDALKTISSDQVIRTVFDAAMRQAGNTGWSVLRAVAPAAHTGPADVEQALRTLQEKQVLSSTGGSGLSGYYSATPLAFEIKESLR